MYAINNAPYSFISFLMGTAQNRIYQNSCVCRAQNCSSPTNINTSVWRMVSFMHPSISGCILAYLTYLVLMKSGGSRKNDTQKITTNAAKRPEETSAPMTKLMWSSTCQCMQHKNNFILLCNYAAQYGNLNFKLIFVCFFRILIIPKFK